MAAGEDDDVSADPGSIGGLLESFTEVELVKNLITSLCTDEFDLVQLELSRDKFKFVIDKYQEQCHLLDPQLDWMLSELIQVARAKETRPAVMHQCFCYLTLITKVRGYKVVVRHLPHEVADLEPVLGLLMQQDPEDVETWETRYMLLLWLSIIVIIPFHLSRLDSMSIGDGHHQKPIAERILHLAKKYLAVSDKAQDAAAYLIAKFITRPDASVTLLPEFLDYALTMVVKWNAIPRQELIGTMLALALLFKHGKREDLLAYAEDVLKRVPSIQLVGTQDTKLRKLVMKLVQRIGLTFLKPRLAHWRYQRGSRSLSSNLSVPVKPSESTTKEVEDEGDYDVPESIEDVVQHLLLGLCDQGTVVRWSAAKGIGRVTSRLSKEMADEIVGTVLELFASMENDNGWHGGCLALAELGRRGLLLPERLPEVVPIILRALVYDEQRGNFSVGSHIRDAACYVCWSFARAYDASHMNPYVHKLASALIVTAVFDREINCRRAASAAFQENVGRQGTFPHGIDILTEADYHAVGIRSHSYLNLSVFIAQFSEYTIPLLSHLVRYKIGHWDLSIRELSASAMHNLTPCDPEHVLTAVLPQLLAMAMGIDLNERHGSILALGETIHALSILAASKNMTVSDLVDVKLINELMVLVTNLQERRLFRGLGGELTRQAVSKYIEKMALAHFPVHRDKTVEVWQHLLDDNLCHESSNVLRYTVQALPAFFSEYYCDENGHAHKHIQEMLVRGYVGHLGNASAHVRSGYALGIGSFPKFLLQGHFDRVLNGLRGCLHQREKEGHGWAETRRDAICALASVCKTVGVESGGCNNQVLNKSNLDVVMDAFLEGFEDYTMDNRGDIGSWVREAAMTGIQIVTEIVVKADPSLIHPDTSSKIMTHLAQQAEEKINRTRAHAAKIFISLLHSYPPLPHIPHYEQLLLIFPEVTCSSIQWLNEAESFPRFTQLLKFPVYTYHTLLGLTLSVGGLTESLVKHSSAALSAHLRAIAVDEQEVNRFCSTLLKIFEDHLHNIRVSIAVLNTIDYLLSLSPIVLIIQNASNSFAAALLNLTKEEIGRTKDALKLVSGIAVFCGLLQAHASVHDKALSQIAMLLCHRYPRVRKESASKLYEALLAYENACPSETVDDAMTILLDTEWDQPVSSVRSKRNELCNLLNIPAPKLVSKSPLPTDN